MRIDSVELEGTSSAALTGLSMGGLVWESFAGAAGMCAVGLSVVLDELSDKDTACVAILFRKWSREQRGRLLLGVCQIELQA